MAGIDVIDKHFSGRFVWSQRDCCTAACDAFLDMWGVDPMACLRGTYATRDEAMERIRERGGFWRMAHDLGVNAGLVARPLGRAGDISLLKFNGIYALGICAAPGVFVGKGPRGASVKTHALANWGVT